MTLGSLPIRLRITVLYSMMFVLVVLLLNLTAWWMLHRSIDSSTYHDLQERTDDVRKQLQAFALQPARTPLQERFDAIYRFRDDGKWLQISDAHGEWVYRSPRMIQFHEPLALSNALAGSGETSDFTEGLHRIRALSSVINVGERAYSVETGTSIDKELALLHQFGLGLWILTPLVLCVAIFAGHSMSRKALEPITAMALEARRINDKNLDQRLPVPPTNDEIAHLSTTLNSMLARIDVGFRKIRDFTANASHELRTPLARLRTEVDIALMHPRSAVEYRGTLEHLQRVAEEMTGLTETLLALSRAETRSDPLTMVAVDAWELIQTVHLEWIPSARRLGLDLRMQRFGAEETNCDGRLWVSGDRASLLRLLHILVDNACKFTPRGGSICLIADEVRDKIRIAVEDSGIGIPEDQQERIFERFYRVCGDTSEQRSGSGLGLNLAAWVAEQHHTSIKLRSSPGAGSCFELLLDRLEGQLNTLTHADIHASRPLTIVSRRHSKDVRA